MRHGSGGVDSGPSAQKTISDKKSLGDAMLSTILICALFAVFLADTIIYGVLAPFDRSLEGRGLMLLLLSMDAVTGLGAAIRLFHGGVEWLIVAQAAYALLIGAAILFGAIVYRSQISGYRRHRAKQKTRSDGGGDEL